MTRPQENVPRHEKHVARNGQSEIRFGIKKMGAGVGNWGVLGEEVADIENYARSEVEIVNENKLKLVDSKTFEIMRNNEQES